MKLLSFPELAAIIGIVSVTGAGYWDLQQKINDRDAPPRSKSLTIQWECDKYREELARVAAQEKAVEEFNKTNKDLSRFAFVEHRMLFTWTPQKGQRELGYRSDGVVVWRELPEGKDAK